MTKQKILDKINRFLFQTSIRFSLRENTDKSFRNNFVSSALEENEAVDAIYDDFEKTFDKVDIGILLNKLMLIKTPLYILNWLRAFLIRRTQRVSVRCSVSEELTVLSGVPQGCY